MKKQRLNKRIVVGLTGGIASGKSTVAQMFRALGAYVIDADAIAREQLKPGTRTYRRVCRAFGSGILRRDKTLDRSALGELVFHNRTYLKKLNRIAHPPVIAEIRRRIGSRRTGLIVVDAPLLFEARCRGMVDKVAVVAAGRAEQIKRLEKNRRLSRTQILARIRSQMSLGNKVRRADFIIDNSLNKRNTKKQVGLIRRQLWRN